MISCLIVDDEQHSIDVLVHHVAQYPLLKLVAATTDPTEALGIINVQKIDLLFQDIHMPELSGIDLVKGLNGKCAVIFTTAYPEHALESYTLGVVDYLLKPISFPRFITAVQKAVEKINISRDSPILQQSGPDFIYVKTGLKNNVIKINFADIEYIESLKNYVAIFHGSLKTLAYLTMRDLEAILPADKFFRIHKSYIISLGRISRIEGCEVILSGVKLPIPIGESYKAGFWEIIKLRTI